MLINLPQIIDFTYEYENELVGYRWYDDTFNRSELGFEYKNLIQCYLNRDDLPELGDISDKNYKGNIIIPCAFKHSQGIYETDVNVHFTLQDIFGRENIVIYPEDLLERKIIENNFKEYYDFFSKIPSFYGVADNVTQILKNKRNYNYFVKSKEKFILTYFTVTKDEDSDWRWGKWGKYIGKQKPKCEYIGDEKNIEKVICYHFYGIKNEKDELIEQRRCLLQILRLNKSEPLTQKAH